MVSRRASNRWVPFAMPDDGWFGKAVVVSGHAVGVRAGRVHREEIAGADVTRESHRSEFVVFARAAAERYLLVFFVPWGDGGNVVTRAVERRARVFRDAAVDDYEGAMRLALHGQDAIERRAGVGDDRASGFDPYRNRAEAAFLRRAANAGRRGGDGRGNVEPFVVAVGIGGHTETAADYDPLALQPEGCKPLGAPRRGPTRSPNRLIRRRFASRYERGRR